MGLIPFLPKNQVCGFDLIYEGYRGLSLPRIRMAFDIKLLRCLHRKSSLEKAKLLDLSRRNNASQEQFTNILNIF